MRDFLGEDLIDEFVISIHPVLLGSGIALFPKSVHELPLKLTKSIAFESGLARLQYTRRR